MWRGSVGGVGGTDHGVWREGGPVDVCVGLTPMPTSLCMLTLVRSGGAGGKGSGDRAHIRAGHRSRQRGAR